jgi:hypothetical protein
METQLHRGGSDLLAVIRHIILPKLKRHWHTLAQISPYQWMPYMIDKMHKAMHILWPRFYLNKAPTLDDKIKLMQVAHKNMILRYQPQCYSGALTLLMTQKRIENKPTLGWDSLATDAVEIQQLAGDYHSYLGKEVKTTAKLLKNCLDKTID